MKFLSAQFAPGPYASLHAPKFPMVCLVNRPMMNNHFCLALLTIKFSTVLGLVICSMHPPAPKHFLDFLYNSPVAPKMPSSACIAIRSLAHSICSVDNVPHQSCPFSSFHFCRYFAPSMLEPFSDFRGSAVLVTNGVSYIRMSTGGSINVWVSSIP